MTDKTAGEKAVEQKPPGVYEVSKIFTFAEAQADYSTGTQGCGVQRDTTVDCTKCSLGKDYRKQIAKEIFEIYDKYIELLVAEIDDLCGLALVHGWKSSRVELGRKCRDAIQQLKKGG